ncbi:L-serine ammonia-lyase [Azospirillum sp. ST 5-10]|uniref:L-serine ammonia-lyase n=1 Tax=unclassified Azospirillum TaxID=2630922 RepID=UPI003F49F038
MTVSVFDIFKIGIGPSSSHTVGPMKAAAGFVADLAGRGVLDRVRRVTAELYGSLALTGPGHGTDRAVLLGLMGEWPETVDPDGVAVRAERVRATGAIRLGDRHVVGFDEARDLLLHRGETLPGHPNGLRFSAFDGQDRLIDARVCYSVGGGFVVTEEELFRNEPAPEGPAVPYGFASGEELLRLTREHGMTIAALVRANERVARGDAELDAGLRAIWDAMKACVARGLTQEGVLPGAFKVRRRAAALHRDLTGRAEAMLRDPLAVMDWISMYAIAVNEENAAGGRVVTAPTNGAAGIVPAVLHYYDRFCHGASERGVFDFLLTATAIGSLYKRNASISGAEVGCQGEVGVACSMAAAGLAAALGATPEQVENAAEIGMEHNLGLTCDPVGGLVQIPCIERNAVGAVKAINAARLALRSDGVHHVSLDKVIKTMRETGADMQSKYKETSLGGLAVNLVEC